MIHSLGKAISLTALTVLLPAAAFAQLPDFSKALSASQERITENQWRLVGDVELSQSDVTFYADQVDYFSDTRRLLAAGNVVFTQPGHRISADRADFNTQTKLGTFYQASGIVSLGARADASLFGTLEPDVYFYGETIEKIGIDRYRITRGAFTTCVQPSPRWELTSGSVVLNVDDYALLKNSLLKVKGVPVLYFPVMYYPINKEGRSTGFLMPTYGSSTIKGQSLSNAFFWAVDRSQDVTVTHDWFSRTGQGIGGEYRYMLAQGSGNLWMNFLKEHQATYTLQNAVNIVPARQSYQMRGAASQAIGRHFRATGRTDYFSNLAVQQTYNTDVYTASNGHRTISGGLNGIWGSYSLNGSYDRSEYFSNSTNSSLIGSAPRISVARAERPIAGTRLYTSVTGEYAHLLRQDRNPSGVSDKSIDRADIGSLLRFPFTRWQFLTVNSSLFWRNTFWSDSFDRAGVRVADPIARRYFDMQAQIVGPVLMRIFDTPGNSYAARFKHSIEPFFTLRRTTAIDNRTRIVQLDGADYTLGDVTQLTYGLAHRLYAKRSEGGAAPMAREILTASLQQTYYTDANAADFDDNYRTQHNGQAPSHLSALSIVVRGTPTNRTTATFRADYDTQYGAFRTLSADTTMATGDWLQATAGWSQRRFIAGLAGYNDPTRLDHFLNGNTTVRFRQSQYGVVHSFNLDIFHTSLLQQRIAGFYNAQCCGFAVEFQTFNFTTLGTSSPVPQDRRFNFSVTLAGLGSFSNFFGALGGTSR